MSLNPWFQVARRPSIVRRAIKVSIVVGTLLVLINHVPALLQGDITRFRLFQIGLTYVVPYCVATWSSVSALIEKERPAP
jgi:hypothetical protein